MTRIGRFWARALLITTLAVGVVAMHATPVPGGADCHDHAASAPALDLIAVPDSHVGHAGSADRPAPCDPAGHHILAMCLAILVALVLLGLIAALRPQRAARRAQRGRERPAPSRPRPARPPPPSSARLAELCVLRS